MRSTLVVGRTHSLSRLVRLLLSAMLVGAPVIVFALPLILIRYVGSDGLVVVRVFGNLGTATAAWIGLVLCCFVGVSYWEGSRWTRAARDAGFEVTEPDGTFGVFPLRVVVFPTNSYTYQHLPDLSGRVRGRTVTISTDVDRQRGSGNRQTLVTAPLSANPGIELAVTEDSLVDLDSLMDGLGLADDRDVEVGDRTFDQRFDVEVSRSNGAEPRRVFTPTVRGELEDVERFGTLSVASSAVVLRTPGRVFDPETLQQQSEAVAQVAAAVENVASLER